MNRFFLGLSAAFLAFNTQALEYASVNVDNNSEYKFLLCSEEAEKVAKTNGDAEYIPAFDRCMEASANNNTSGEGKIIASR